MMPTAAKLRNDIDNLLDVLLQADVIMLRRPVVLLGNKHHAKITWANSAVRPGHETVAGTIAEYLDQLDCDAYSAILMDGSIVQLEYEIESSTIVWHRLAFYPCPYVFDKLLVEEFAFRDVIEASESIEAVRLRTPVRFDYDPGGVDEKHSASHVHLNHEECRIAVCAPVCPSGFMRFIGMNFFPTEWDTKFELRGIRPSSMRRTIRRSDESEWHLNQRAV
jgi:hypothetical protein